MTTASNPVAKRAFVMPEKQMSLETVSSDTNKALAQNIGILPTFVPSTVAEMTACLADPLWRICRGKIFKIMVKASDGEDSAKKKAIFSPHALGRTDLGEAIFGLAASQVLPERHRLGICAVRAAPSVAGREEWHREIGVHPAETA